MLTDTYERVRCADVQILRAERQRRIVETGNLRESIALRGVYNPIIIRRDGNKFILIAGERRLTASIELGLPDIPARFAEDLSPIERRLIELEENVRRSDLHWRDDVRAVAEIHKLYSSTDPDWSLTDTAEAIGLDRVPILRRLRVATDIDSNVLREAASLESAYNLLARLDERKAHDAINDIIDTSHNVFNKPAAPGDPIAPKAPPKVTTEDSLMNESFLEWAPLYSGPRFNFVHCDFPYGIEAFAGSQSGRSESYSDTSDDYWNLVSCLCGNLDRLMSPSAHLMFWFSMEHYTQTLATFARLAPSLNFSAFPLIWMKSDNSGIIPDANRGPRRIYETALIASREDRRIAKPVGNAYSSPIDRQWHPSTKPEPMLRFFFQMFVDDNTIMLDPTCGGGSALRAAESLGAKRVLGLEKDKSYYDNAAIALRKFRLLNRAAERIGV